MFDTGKRTIADVLKDHVGHSTQIRNVYQGDMILGVQLICMTCGFTLLRQDFPEPIAMEFEEVVGGSVVETPVSGWDTQDTGCVNDTGWDTQNREWST